MKKLYTLLFAAALFCTNANAQISAGGQPESFSKPNLSETIEVKTMPASGYSRHYCGRRSAWR
jgi:hypothetical protein